MSPRGALVRVYDVVFREFPHRDGTGLMKIGSPGRDSPVVVTGNYTETVRRVKVALRGENVWLLVANSKGVNVWCASSGGYLTHHDIISAVVTSGADREIDNRVLILPQLGATGIERQKITDATGWSTVWGPARVEDLPPFMHGGHRATPRQRFMRFPIRDRLELAITWWLPLVVVSALLSAWLGGWPVGLAAVAGTSAIAFGTFAGLPWLRITGIPRLGTFALVALLGFACAAAPLWILGSASVGNLAVVGAGATAFMAVLSVDLAGMTPWYASSINTFRNQARIDLVADRCTGTSECVQVCPRNVFEMAALKRVVNVVRPADCVECGACIVQCPRDALRFRFEDGRVVEPATIRRTRMNMLGRRTVAVPEQE